MSNFGGLILTNRGRNLQSKAQAGVQLQYTRIGVGDGSLGSTSMLSLNALINEVMSLNITKLKTLGDGKAVVGTVLSNQDMAEGFYFREIGVYATDPDFGEILYCYGNAGELAEYISPGGGSDIIEKSIDIQTVIGNAQNVSAIIDESLVYATKQDLENIIVPVTSVNTKTGDVVLSASDIQNSEGKTIELKLTEQSTQMADLETNKVDKTAISDSVTSTSSTNVASSKAVKAAYDKGNHAHPYAPSSHVGAGGTAHAIVTTSANGFMSAADKSKLNGIEAGATKDMTASEILVALKTVDTDTSGLNANFLQGKTAGDFQFSESTYGTISFSDVVKPLSTLTKKIVIPPNKKRGTVYSSYPKYSIITYFSNDATKTYAISSNRGNASIVHAQSSTNLGSVGVNEYIKNVYISGNYIVIIFENGDNDSDFRLSSREILWEVW